MKLCFIINPRAGRDRVKAIQAAIDAQIDPGRHGVTLQYTEHAGQGTELAREAVAAGAEAVIAVGGDGSVRDVAKGILGSPAALGILPKGSGNGLARSLHIPLAEGPALNLINKGLFRTIDVGFANEELFLSNAGVGFDALIAKVFAGSRRRGLPAYAWLSMRHFWKYHSPEWQISLDGKEWRQRAFILNVANGNQLGYNFRIAPQALPDDGWLDLSIVKEFPKALGGGIAWRALRGTIQGSRRVEHLRLRELRISHPRLQLMQTDGDAHPCGPTLHIRIVPAALKVLAE